MSDPLETIAAEAAQLDGIAPAGAEPGAPPAAQLAAGDEERIAMWAMVPTVAGKILCMALPELRDAYSADNCRAWGEAMLAVAKKRGWDIGANAPEFTLAAASLTFVIPTVGAIVARRSAERAERAKRAAKQAAGEGSAVVSNVQANEAAPPQINAGGA